MIRNLKLTALAMFIGIGAISACAPTPPPVSGSPASPTTTVVMAPVGTTHAITFPVSPTARYQDWFGAPRSGGRSHQGQDLMAPKGSPVVAAVSGKVTRIKHDTTGLSGNYLVLTGDDGWTYHYMHLNNDTPGTDDGANLYEQAFAPGISVGSKVAAGTHLGYVGDSGNAENAGSHLHFEMRTANKELVNPFQSLKQASPAPKIVSPIGTWTSA